MDACGVPESSSGIKNGCDGGAAVLATLLSMTGATRGKNQAGSSAHFDALTLTSRCRIGCQDAPEM